MSTLHPEKHGFGVIASADAPLSVSLGGTGGASASAARDALEVGQNVVDPPFGNVLRPWWLSNNTGTILVEQTLYAVYLGRTKRAITVANVFCHVVTIATGTQTAEMGLATSADAPDGNSKTLTKLVASGSLDALTGTGIKGPSSALNQAVSAGVHLWAVMRTAMSSNEPTCLAVTGDLNRGYVLVATGQSAITGLTSWTGAVPTLGNGGVAPLLFATYT